MWTHTLMSSVSDSEIKKVIKEANKVSFTSFRALYRSNEFPSHMKGANILEHFHVGKTAAVHKHHMDIHLKVTRLCI